MRGSLRRVGLRKDHADAVDDLRQLQFTHGKWEARAKEAEAAIELAQYRAGEKNRELEKLQSLL